MSPGPKPTLRHPCILGGPQQREQNQKSKPTLGVTMMHHATKRGFKDCPGFLNSTGRLGPKRGRKCYITPAFSGVPNKGGQNQNSKPPLRVTMMPLGAPSISKYGSLVRPNAQIVALRVHCARTALEAPPMCGAVSTIYVSCMHHLCPLFPLCLPVIYVDAPPNPSILRISRLQHFFMMTPTTATASSLPKPPLPRGRPTPRHPFFEWCVPAPSKPPIAGP